MSTTVAVIDPRESRSGRNRRRWIDRLVAYVVYASATVTLATIALIFIFIGREALPVFTSSAVREEVTLETMYFPQEYGTAEVPLSYVWQPVSDVPKYSLIPLFVGTLKIVAVAMMVAVPIALLAAIYTAEFAPRWIRESIKPTVELLAGIPSVVLGFFALIVFASWFQSVFGLDFRLNVTSAGIVLGLAVIPIIYTLSEDALHSVTQQVKDAAFALGASTWQVAFRVSLPAALPGIFAGVVLGMGRAMGETMIVLMASGNAAVTSWSFTEPVRTLPATLAAELAEVVFGSPHYHVLFFVGTVLFLVTFLLNWLGATVIRGLNRRLAGESP